MAFKLQKESVPATRASKFGQKTTRSALSKLQSTGLFYPLQPPRVPHSASDVSPRSRSMSPGVTSSQSQPPASRSFPTRGPHEFIRSAHVNHVTSISAEYRQICRRQFQRGKMTELPFGPVESSKAPHQLSGNRAHRQTQVLGISVLAQILRDDSVRVNKL